MTRTWRFTEAEFYALWMDRTGQAPPKPFLFTSPTLTADDFEAEQREAREGLSDKAVGDFHLVFDAMANPDLFVTAYGWDEQDPFGTDSMIRARGTRKGPKGYLIRQLSGTSYFSRGGYTITECDPIQLADEIVRAMPSVARGGLGDIVMASHEQDMDHDFGRSTIAAAPDTAVSRSREFLARQVATAGEIQIVQGRSVFGPRGITRHTVRFRDLQGDGRYVVTENPERALAVDEARFISVLNNYVAAVVQTIRDERG
ncbi:ESX secretion-associated protein EspG [Nocardia yunnanensis]|uniref:ESX secretion-associated protein EspG n=1 Tax=Nocardia yunnanensis TaxID=2382165 RepID=A0A386ZGE1_9NOCA|nr:ESX secretion-associated protein EspG [Nocardia yunnanensis]AYF76588.1 ESX secretion-associated protein EspG [Nocardia yunnanensis]